MFRPRRTAGSRSASSQDLGTSQSMAVTVEPSDCPSQPTTTPIMTADLTVA